MKLKHRISISVREPDGGNVNVIDPLLVIGIHLFHHTVV